MYWHSHRRKCSYTLLLLITVTLPVQSQQRHRRQLSSRVESRNLRQTVAGSEDLYRSRDPLLIPRNLKNSRGKDVNSSPGSKGSKGWNYSKGSKGTSNIAGFTGFTGTSNNVDNEGNSSVASSVNNIDPSVANSNDSYTSNPQPYVPLETATTTNTYIVPSPTTPPYAEVHPVFSTQATTKRLTPAPSVIKNIDESIATSFNNFTRDYSANSPNTTKIPQQNSFSTHSTTNHNDNEDQPGYVHQIPVIEGTTSNSTLLGSLTQGNTNVSVANTAVPVSWIPQLEKIKSSTGSSSP